MPYDTPLPLQLRKTQRTDTQKYWSFTSFLIDCVAIKCFRLIRMSASQAERRGLSWYFKRFILNNLDGFWKRPHSTSTPVNRGAA